MRMVEHRTLLTDKQLQLLQNTATPSPVDLGLCLSSVWQHLLPDFRHIQRLYLEEPLLYIGGGDIQKDIQRVRKGVNLNAVLDDLWDDWEAESQHNVQNNDFSDDGWLQDLHMVASRISAGWQSEKLEVTKGAIGTLNEIEQSVAGERWNGNLIGRLAIQRTPRVSSPPTMEDYFVGDEILTAGCHEVVQSPTLSRSSELISMGNDIMSTGEMLKLLDESEQNAKAADLILPDPVLSIDVEHYSTPASILKRSLSDTVLPQSRENRVKRRRVSIDRLIQSKMNDSSPQMPKQTSRTKAQIESTFKVLEGSAPGILLKLEAEVDNALLISREFNTLEKEPISSYDRTENDLKTKRHSSLGDFRITLSKVTPKNVSTISPRTFEQAKTLLLSKMLGEQLPLFETDCKHERIMIWAPFPITSCHDIQAETIEGENNITQKVFANIERPLRSENLLWKSPGTMLLEDNDDDASNSSLSVTSCSDNDSAAKLIKDKPASIKTFTKLKPGPDTPESGSEYPRGGLLQDRATFGSLGCSTDTEAVFEGKTACSLQEPIFSASASLSAFLDLRGKRFSRTENGFAYKASHLLEDQIKSIEQSHKLYAHRAELSPQSKEAISNSLSPCYPLEWHRTIVLNNKLMQANPELVAFCERWSEDLLTIIYRDFGEVDSVAPDIILGPSSCLTITNIQSFMQRCLPGQAKCSSLSLAHEHAIRLAHKYESVLMLIALSETTIPGATIMTELSAFCSSISIEASADVRPIYVHHGTIQQLKDAINNLTWMCIHEFAFPSRAVKERSAQASTIRFIQDDTVWELFLRRAGMNAVAAQVVLSMMKDLEEEQPAIVSKSGMRLPSGLGRFLQMNLGQRMDIFRSILGHRVVESVSSVLDGKLVAVKSSRARHIRL